MIRITEITNPKSNGVDSRFPDSLGKRYLAITTLLMTTLEDMVNKIHKADVMDIYVKDLETEDLMDPSRSCKPFRQSNELISQRLWQLLTPVRAYPNDYY